MGLKKQSDQIFATIPQGSSSGGVNKEQTFLFHSITPVGLITNPKFQDSIVYSASSESGSSDSEASNPRLIFQPASFVGEEGKPRPEQLGNFYMDWLRDKKGFLFKNKAGDFVTLTIETGNLERIEEEEERKKIETECTQRALEEFFPKACVAKLINNWNQQVMSALVKFMDPVDGLIGEPYLPTPRGVCFYFEMQGEELYLRVRGGLGLWTPDQLGKEGSLSDEHIFEVPGSLEVDFKLENDGFVVLSYNTESEFLKNLIQGGSFSLSSLKKSWLAAGKPPPSLAEAITAQLESDARPFLQRYLYLVFIPEIVANSGYIDKGCLGRRLFELLLAERGENFQINSRSFLEAIRTAIKEWPIEDLKLLNKNQQLLGTIREELIKDGGVLDQLFAVQFSPQFNQEGVVQVEFARVVKALAASNINDEWLVEQVGLLTSEVAEYKSDVLLSLRSRLVLSCYDGFADELPEATWLAKLERERIDVILQTLFTKLNPFEYFTSEGDSVSGEYELFDGKRDFAKEVEALKCDLLELHSEDIFSISVRRSSLTGVLSDFNRKLSGLIDSRISDFVAGKVGGRFKFDCEQQFRDEYEEKLRHECESDEEFNHVYTEQFEAFYKEKLEEKHKQLKGQSSKLKLNFIAAVNVAVSDLDRPTEEDVDRVQKVQSLCAEHKMLRVAHQKICYDAKEVHSTFSGCAELVRPFSSLGNSTSESIDFVDVVDSSLGEFSRVEKVRASVEERVGASSEYASSIKGLFVSASISMDRKQAAQQLKQGHEDFLSKTIDSCEEIQKTVEGAEQNSVWESIKGVLKRLVNRVSCGYFYQEDASLYKLSGNTASLWSKFGASGKFTSQLESQGALPPSPGQAR